MCEDLTLAELGRRIDRFEADIKADLRDLATEMDKRADRQARWVVPIAMLLLSNIATVIVQLVSKR